MQLINPKIQEKIIPTKNKTNINKNEPKKTNSNKIPNTMKIHKNNK